MKPAKFVRCIIGALVAVLIGQHAQGAEGGAEWTQITEDETKLVFDAPGVEGGVRRFYKRTMQYEPHYQELGIWVGPTGRYPRAQIVTTELSSYYYYEQKEDLKDMVRGMLKDKEVSFGKENTSENVVGDISYLKYTYELGQCVAFSQYWGESVSPALDVGEAHLFGFYCVEEPLDRRRPGRGNYRRYGGHRRHGRHRWGANQGFGWAPGHGRKKTIIHES